MYSTAMTVQRSAAKLWTAKYKRTAWAARSNFGRSYSGRSKYGNYGRPKVPEVSLFKVAEAPSNNNNNNIHCQRDAISNPQ